MNKYFIDSSREKQGIHFYIYSALKRYFIEDNGILYRISAESQEEAKEIFLLTKKELEKLKKWRN